MKRGYCTKEDIVEAQGTWSSEYANESTLERHRSAYRLISCAVSASEAIDSFATQRAVFFIESHGNNLGRNVHLVFARFPNVQLARETSHDKLYREPLLYGCGVEQ